MYLLEPREKGWRMKSPPSSNKDTATARDAEQEQAEGGARYSDLSFCPPFDLQLEAGGQEAQGQRMCLQGPGFGHKAGRRKIFVLIIFPLLTEKYKA